MYLPPLVDYHCPDNSGMTDVRVWDHKVKSLHVGVRLHRMDMALSEEREASGSCIQSRHHRGLLLGYLLAPRTGNLCFEEVVSRVLQENHEGHKRMKRKSLSLFQEGWDQWSRLLGELDKLSKALDAAKGKKAQREIEERMSVLHTALNRVEASIAKTEDCLEQFVQLS